MGGCISKDSANAEADNEIVDHETKSIFKDSANAEDNEEIVDHEIKGESIFENFLLAVCIEVIMVNSKYFNIHLFCLSR